MKCRRDECLNEAYKGELCSFHALQEYYQKKRKMQAKNVSEPNDAPKIQANTQMIKNKMRVVTASTMRHTKHK